MTEHESDRSGRVESNVSSSRIDATTRSTTVKLPLVFLSHEQSTGGLSTSSAGTLEDATYQRLKVCKRGHREAFVEKVCGVSFEGLPVWLWSLRLAEWSTIYITDTDDLKLRQHHLTTWEFARSKLAIVDAKAVGTLLMDMWLVSGSLAFVTSAIGPLGTPKLAWMSEGGRRKPSLADGWEWLHVSHAMVGGVTKATGIFGSVGMAPIEILKDPIRRTIGHVIKYSERPTPCELPVSGLRHYTIEDRLSLHHLHLPVVFASGFSRTGWGHRRLVNAELEHAFDLPSFVSWESLKGAKVVPIHLCRVVMDGALKTLGGTVQGRGAARARKKKFVTPTAEVGPVVSPLPLDEPCWLPQMKKWLPGTWTDTSIADKAVKSDNAAVDFHPWNQRIMLILPCTSSTIVSMEELALRIWRRRLTMSFLQYLLTWRHGASWALNVVGATDSGKRKRVLALSGHGTANKVGGIRDIDLSELGRDLKRGRLILRQVLRSKWWEWSYGSSLFFWRWNGAEQVAAARDGMRMYVQSQLPVGRKRQKVRLKPEVQALVAEKIEAMCKRYYLESSGHVANSLD